MSDITIPEHLHSCEGNRGRSWVPPNAGTVSRSGTSGRVDNPPGKPSTFLARRYWCLKSPTQLVDPEGVPFQNRRVIFPALVMVTAALVFSACGSTTSASKPKSQVVRSSCPSPASCVQKAIQAGFVSNNSLQVPSGVVAMFQQGWTTALEGVNRHFFEFRYQDKSTGMQVEEMAVANPPFFQRCVPTSEATPTVSPGGRAVCFVLGGPTGSFVTFSEQNFEYQISITGRGPDSTDNQRTALLGVVDQLQPL
jgi:hypothetical protein